MAWWRRDLSLWCRSPLQGYARQVLRDNDAILRSRNFSKSQPTSAQHKDDEDRKRPAGLSSLEWIQLQHYRRWKRRLHADPYRALFGASNDMLDGKGLKDWQRVYKAFPKWMVKEVDNFENQEPPKREDSRASKDDGPKTTHQTPSPPQPPKAEVYPKNVHIFRTERPGSSPSNARESVFPEPSFKSSSLGRAEYSSEVVSPSDPRRPREHVLSEDRSTTTTDSSATENDAPGGEGAHSTSQEVKPQKHAPEKESHKWKEFDRSAKAPAYTAKPAAKEAILRPNQEAMSRESTFIKKFLVDSPNTDSKMSGESSDWRQTVLDRRLAPKLSPRLPGTRTPETPPINTFIAHKTDTSGVTTGSLNHAQPSSPETAIGLQLSKVNKPLSAQIAAEEDAKVNDEDQNSNGRAFGISQLDGPSLQARAVLRARSTSEVLHQLPEDDIDFLSAEEIRASMAAKTKARESIEKRQKARADLERQYQYTHKEGSQLHPMIASKIVNDQHMRRIVREMEMDRKAGESTVGPLAKEVPTEMKDKEVTTLSSTSKPDPSTETRIDRMTRWLQSGGDAFAKHFWSEPILGNHVGLPTGQQHKAIVAGVRAGRSAMEQVEEVIENVIPPSVSLLGRLKDNEEGLIRSTRFMLGPRLILSTPDATFKSKHKIRKVRDDLKKTEEEFEEACKALDAMEGKDLLNSSKRGLKSASLVLQKNVKLTRRIAFRVQALEENPAAAQHTERFKEVKNRLTALQDTQMALLRLVERAIQLFGPPSKPADVEMVANMQGLQGPFAITVPGLSNDFEDPPAASQPEESISGRNTALNQNLNEEIAAQKSSMRGLSDDGYARPPKPSQKKTLDEPCPLANSLLRPFGPLYESLGREQNIPADKLESQALKDNALVQEIKKSYEDVYGPITVDHRQIEEKENTKPAGIIKDNGELSGVQWSEDDVVRGEPVEAGIAPNAPEVHSDPAKIPYGEVKDSGLFTHPHWKATWINRELDSPSKSAIRTPLEGHPFTFPSDTVSQQFEEPSLTASSEAAPTTFEQPPLIFPAEEAQESRPEAATMEATYKILAYDPSTDELHITVTTSKSTTSSGPAIPLHQALAQLDAPAKFVPHFSSCFEIVTTKPNLVVLRESTTPREQILNSGVHNENEVRDGEWKRINPVDGTTRLSPTGFVGVEPDLRDEHDASQRRKFYETWKVENERKEGRKEEKERKSKKGGATAGVFKMAIIASAGCYIAGVIGELVR